MDRNLLKLYIKRIDKGMIEKYAIKNDIRLSTDELDIIYNSIKNDVDNILNSDFYKYISEYKTRLSTEVYNKIIELYEKYKDFIK